MSPLPLRSVAGEPIIALSLAVTTTKEFSVRHCVYVYIICNSHISLSVHSL
jgi:hypothetical protein